MFDTVNHGILLENLCEAGVICHPSIKSPVEFPRGQSLEPYTLFCVNVCDLLMQPNNSDVTLLMMQRTLHLTCYISRG